MRSVPDLQKDARMWLSRRLNRSFAPPDWLSVNVTLRCNLACVMCTTCYDAPEMDLVEIRGLIDQAALWGVKVFNPLGGEPFARRDLEDILEHASHRDLYTTLTTNGTLLTPERAARVARIPPEKLHLTLSIDGLEAAHDAVRGAGAWARTVAGYRNLRAADEAAGNIRRTIGANVLLHRGNCSSFMELLRWLADEGFSAVQVLNLFRGEDDPTVGGMWFKSEDLGELTALCTTLAQGGAPLPLRNSPADLALIPRYYQEGLRPLDAPCWAGWKELYINSDGSAIMCDGKLDFLAGRFGSVRASTLRELWASPALAERRAVVKTCTTPCIQGCYLRRESDSLTAVAAAAVGHAAAGLRARIPATPRRIATPLTLELSDVPTRAGHPLLGRFLRRAGVDLATLEADPDRLAALRDQGRLDADRGFMGAELLERVLEGIVGARLEFAQVRLDWRGDPLLHPELDRVLRMLSGPLGGRAIQEVILHTDGRLLGPAARRTFAAHPKIRVAVDAPASADGPAVSWDARLTSSRRDEHLQHKVGNVLEEGFAVAWARLSASPR